MNVSIETLLADAKLLVGRLKEHDNAAQTLAEQSSGLQKDIEARNTYQENLKELNKVAGHRPRSTLVLGIQQENCAIRSLQNENDDLRQSLTDHQNALELIMTKYRHQMMQFTNNKNNFQMHSIRNRITTSEISELSDSRKLMNKVNEMAAVMRQAITLDEEQCKAQQEYISRIEAENHGLRQLLMITNSPYGAHLKHDPENDDQTAAEKVDNVELKSDEDEAKDQNTVENEKNNEKESSPPSKSISLISLNNNSSSNNDDNANDERYSDDEEETDDDTDTICNDFPLS